MQGEVENCVCVRFPVCCFLWPWACREVCMSVSATPAYFMQQTKHACFHTSLAIYISVLSVLCWGQYVAGIASKPSDTSHQDFCKFIIWFQITCDLTNSSGMIPLFFLFFSFVQVLVFTADKFQFFHGPSIPAFILFLNVVTLFWCTRPILLVILITVAAKRILTILPV